MPSYDHGAIWRAYPNTVGRIEDDRGVFDRSGNAHPIDQNLVDAARAQIDIEEAAAQYKEDRITGIGTTAGYPDWREQMDMLYHDIKSGTLNTSGQWYVGITTVKTNIPKPS